MLTTKKLMLSGDYGRGGEIRTHDPLYPKQVRYQTAPRPGPCAVPNASGLI